MGLKEAGGTDILTILPAGPRDMGLVVAPDKVVNQDLDKIRITAAGIMGASALVGMMYFYACATRKWDKEKEERKAMKATLKRGPKSALEAYNCSGTFLVT